MILSYKPGNRRSGIIHQPVLLERVIEYLDIKPDGIYVDATLGDGGHAEAICRHLSADGRLLGLDADEDALKRAGENLKAQDDKLFLVQDNFCNLVDVLAKYGISGIDGVLLDLGVSSYQVDTPERGFSFHYDGPLDMRMSRHLSSSACEVVNNYERGELVRVFKELGEERWASRIASFIVDYREKKEISTTAELVEIIKSAIPARYRRKGGHPARKVFQALRIEVNRELEHLKAVLPGAADSLNPGGRLVVISYHSLEDRLVKHFIRERSSCSCPPELPVCRCSPDLRIVSRKPVLPGEEEVVSNPRARSARMRVAEKRF